MNKVTIGQLVQFQKDSSNWFGQDPNTGKFMNKQNAESPLGGCIMRIMPQVEKLIESWVDLGLKYNQEVSIHKASYAEKVTIMENSAMQNHVTTNYEYTGAQLKERNRVIQTLWEKLVSDRKEMETLEVEIEPVYVKNVPPDSILPPMFITSFRGLVIDPEHDHNKFYIHK